MIGLVVRQTLRTAMRDREFPGTVFLMAFIFGAIGFVIPVAMGAEGTTTDLLTALFFIGALVVPMVGLMIGLDVIAPKRADGQLRLLLGQPLSRTSILFGGAIAKGVIVAVAVAAGVLAALVASLAMGLPVDVGDVGLFGTGLVGLALAYLGLSVAMSASLSSSRWATFAAFGAFIVLVVAWRFVPTGVLFVMEGFALPETEPGWVGLVATLSPSVAFERIADAALAWDLGFIVQDPPGLTYAAGVLVAWIALIPLVGAWRLRRADL